MELEELLHKRTEACELFSNPARSLIAVILHGMGEASWADIKSHVETLTGPMNPNTLSFHLGRLIKSGLVEKVGTEQQPRYVSTKENDKEIELKLGSDLVNMIRERISKE